MGDIILDAAFFAALPLVAIEFKSIVEIVSGVGLTFMGTIQVLATSLPDIMDGVVTLIQFGLSNLVCGFKLLGNFHKCFFYYILDIIGQLLYLPVRITFWAFKHFLGLDMYPIETGLWDGVEKFDCFIYSKAGFHLAHYPESTINDCYNCCRVRTSLITEKGEKIHKGIMKTAPQLLIPGIDLISQGADSFMHPFG